MTYAPMTNAEWSEHVRNGEAFAAEGNTPGAGGMFAHIQLFNPLASAVRVRLWALQTLTVFALGRNQNIRRHDVAIGAVSFFAGPENLLGGGPGPVAEIRSASLGALAGSAFWLQLTTGGTNQGSDYPPQGQVWGHDLLPGQGLVVAAPGAGDFVANGFLWAEVPL